MSSYRAILIVCTTAALGLVAWGETRSEAQSDLVSAWRDINEFGRVRLIAGASHPDTATAVAGVQIALAEGWKTYWRMPGDAGVPPVFDWSASQNVASIKVLYPAPMRLQEPAAETIGYKHEVIFPVQLKAKEPGKPVDLKLDIEFGICREICVPAVAKLALDIPAGQAIGPSPALVTALEQVPRPAELRRSTDPQLLRVVPELEGSSPRLLIEARFAGKGKGADVFVEAPDGLYVPLPKRLADAGSGTAQFLIDLSRGGNAHELKGKVLTITLVSDAGATEATWKLN